MDIGVPLVVYSSTVPIIAPYKVPMSLNYLGYLELIRKPEAPHLEARVLARGSTPRYS